MNRASLKSLFSKGKFPSENHFAHLIDSTVNKMEDGIGKSAEEGLQLSPQGEADPVLSIYERMDVERPSWQLKLLRDNDARGLSFEKLGKDEFNQETSSSRLFLSNEGNIGVNTTQPLSDLHVNGTLGHNARIGTLVMGEVEGDGKWHTVIGGLSGPQAFEAVARIDGPTGKAKYAFTHAIALSTYGGRRSRWKIKQTRAYYGWFWNRIDFKWDGDTFAYALKVRTRQNYGKGEDGSHSKIRFHLSSLWDDRLFSTQHFTPTAPTGEKENA